MLDSLVSSVPPKVAEDNVIFSAFIQQLALIFPTEKHLLICSLILPTVRPDPDTVCARQALSATSQRASIKLQRVVRGGAAGRLPSVHARGSALEPGSTCSFKLCGSLNTQRSDSL